MHCMVCTIDGMAKSFLEALSNSQAWLAGVLLCKGLNKTTIALWTSCSDQA